MEKHAIRLTIATVTIHALRLKRTTIDDILGVSEMVELIGYLAVIIAAGFCAWAINLAFNE